MRVPVQFGGRAVLSFRRPELALRRHDPAGLLIVAVGKRDDDADQPPVLVVEDMAA